MTNPRYTSFQDFEREELRPDMRIGWSTDELEHGANAELDFDLDPFEAQLQAAEAEKEDE